MLPVVLARPKNKETMIQNILQPSIPLNLHNQYEELRANGNLLDTSTPSVTLV